MPPEPPEVPECPLTPPLLANSPRGDFKAEQGEVWGGAHWDLGNWGILEWS